MTRIETDPRLPAQGSIEYERTTRNRLYDLFRAIARQLNGISEGQISAVTNAATSAPSGTSQTYNQGDKIWHSTPVEAGASGSRYIILGWCCVVSGAPGTWREMRVLTGN